MTTATTTGQGMSEQAVLQINETRESPEWLRLRRVEGWRRFESLPVPSRRDENWRFTDLRGLKLDERQSYSAGAEDAAGDFRNEFTGEIDAAARIVQVDGDTVSTTSGDLPAGVIALPLEQAAIDHADLVRQHLGTAVASADHVNEKFVALNEAFWTGGLFLYVPKNVRIDAPVVFDALHATDGGSLTTRVLIVLETGAEATFVEQYTSVAADSDGFTNVAVEVVIADGATLHYVTTQDLSEKVAHFATHRALVQKDATVDWVAVGFGGAYGKDRMEVRLLGAGSTAKMTGVYSGENMQRMDYDTQQFHEAPNAVTDLAFRGVLTDRASVVWRGMIDVAEGAQGTDAFQQNKNLILSEKAHADSIPGLQIEANEVRCTHASTTSKVDAEQLFYLQARGLTKAAATELIVKGFFTPVLDRIASEPVRESVQERLWERVAAR